MPKPRLRIEQVSAEEIRKMLRKDEKFMIGVRLYAVYQIANGFASRDIEKMYKVSFKAICNWVHEFNNYGLEGLKDKPRSGRKPRLDQTQMVELKEIIIKDEPTKFGYNTSTWTGPLLIDLIQKRYGITFKKAQIYNILKLLGLSYQKGKGIYPEADEVKRNEFSDTLKKTSNRDKQSGNII